MFKCPSPEWGDAGSSPRVLMTIGWHDSIAMWGRGWWQQWWLNWRTGHGGSVTTVAVVRRQWTCDNITMVSVVVCSNDIPTLGNIVNDVVDISVMQRPAGVLTPVTITGSGSVIALTASGATQLTSVEPRASTRAKRLGQLGQTWQRDCKFWLGWWQLTMRVTWICVGSSPRWGEGGYSSQRWQWVGGQQRWGRVK